jgi:hypothetical protein
MSMTKSKMRGISRKGLSQEFLEGEQKASNLILHAHLLKAQQQMSKSADLFAQAAALEEYLCIELEQKGLIPKMLSHAFSAVGCWAQAGNIHLAIERGEELLQRPDCRPSFASRWKITSKLCAPDATSG